MISLLYCGNDKMFDGILISLLSIAKTASEPLDVSILTMDLSGINPLFTPLTEEQGCFMESLLKEKKPRSRLKVYGITELFLSEMKNSPNLNSVYTPYTLLRLFADELPLPEKILYLDADTAAARDIAPVFEVDTGGSPYAGVLDYLGKIFIHPRYINAGVLLLDLEAIRSSGFFQRARQFCAEKKTPFPDQDAINRLAKNKCILPRCYNEQRKMKEDTVIRHFSKSIRWLPFYHTVNVKPWDIEGMHRIYHLYDFDPVLEEYQEALEKWNRNFRKEAFR